MEITGDPDFDLLNIEYDGGDGDDALSLSMNYTKITYNYSSPSDGDVLFKDGLGVTKLGIAYTGLEPISNTGTDGYVVIDAVQLLIAR